MENKKLKNFKIERKVERIKIKIEVNETMVENWKFNLKNPTYITITKERMPKRFFRDGTRKTKTTKSIYYTRKETAFILRTVILRNNTSSWEKRAKILKQIYDMGVNNRSLYSKIILEKDEAGVFLPKTIYLVGDESTGLLYYL
jgi:hypothetical protein